ncbi:MAG: enoyl-CoA hydratase/isomerase family protein [Candidatus Hodarchaeota archaeon]
MVIPEDHSDSVLYEKKEHVATVIINRPEKRNALRMKEFDSIIKNIQAADSDPTVHIIRIKSSGDRAFSAGLDLNMIQQMTPETVPKLLQYGYNLVRTMIQSKKPIIVQVQGPAVAWGAIICLAADFVIAGNDPKLFLSLPEIDVGLFPATGALTTTLFNTEFRRAKRILMIPEKISLDEAVNLGIITSKHPMDSLEENTMKFCHELASKPQSILIPIKALINNFYLRGLESFFEKETEAFNLAMAGEVDNFDAFIQKLWKNK